MDSKKRFSEAQISGTSKHAEAGMVCSGELNGISYHSRGSNNHLRYWISKPI